MAVNLNHRKEVTRTTLLKNCVKFLQSQVFTKTFPSFVTLTQVFQTIPLTSVPCERYFSAQNRIHGALRNKMSPSAVECKMHISYAYKRHVDEESFGDRAVKKFNKMKNRRK